MQNEIKAVIWDMGGVLLRTEDKTPRLDIIGRLGITLDELFDVVFFSESGQKAEVGEIEEEDHWKFVGQAFGLTQMELEQLRVEFWSGDRLDKTLMEFINALRPQFATALLSNAWSGTRTNITQRYNLLDVFDKSIFSAEVGLVKPDERIYRLMLRELGIEPFQAVFIDDLPRNVEAAQGIGIHPVLFTSAEQVLEKLDVLLQLPDKKLSSS